MTRRTIPLSEPNLTGNEVKYVVNAVKTGWVSSAGPYVTEFEQRIAAYVQAKGAVSCQNGTAGLHVGLRLCGVGPGDEVLVPTLTFIAAVNPVRYLGADPVFMDCDDSLNLDPEKLLEFCERECEFVDGQLINRTSQKQVKAIVVVHVFGKMVDMEQLLEVAARYDLAVVEDATEALGTYYTRGRFSGKYAGTMGDVGVYSFNGNKIITTGGGGMIVADNEDLLKQAKHLTTQAKSDDLYYTHDEIGYNYRLTNLQAALGLAQLEQLERFIETKRRNYELYRRELSKVEGLRLLDFADGIRPNYWFYSMYCDPRYPLNRDEIIRYLASKGIQTRPIWGLISDQKPYRKCQSYRIEKAKHYWERVVNLPCSSNLTEEDVLYVVDCLKNAVGV